MKVTGEAEFVSSKTGTKGDGSTWNMLKFLDDESDEFFTAFVNDDVYKQMMLCPKHTAVVLTLNITPGKKYFRVETIEIIES